MGWLIPGAGMARLSTGVWRRIFRRASQRIERASYPRRAHPQDVRVDHRRLDVGVPQELLHGPNVVTRGRKVCGMARSVVSQRLRRGRSGDACPRRRHAARESMAMALSPISDLLIEKENLFRERAMALLRNKISFSMGPMTSSRHHTSVENEIHGSIFFEWQSFGEVKNAIEEGHGPTEKQNFLLDEAMESSRHHTSAENNIHGSIFSGWRPFREGRMLSAEGHGSTQHNFKGSSADDADERR
jgi:hypothetical protein